MNRVVQLVRTDALTLERFDHTPGVAHRDPERERADGYAVNFVETGSFRVRTKGAWHEVGADRLFVTTPGLEFSCAHADDHPQDRCLSVSFSDQALESARSTLKLGESTVLPLTNRRAYLQHALGECGAGTEARAEAIAGALLQSLSNPESQQPLFRRERLTWYAARVNRAKALMEARFAETLSLSAIARDAGMSVYHFARVFAELEGQSPHRYLIDVRLGHAAARLRDGASVTDTCLAVGFGSLSHFVTTFRRRYGVTPSGIASLSGITNVRFARADARVSSR